MGSPLRTARWPYVLYFCGSAVTFIFLTFFDGYRYTAWNWLVAIPVNFLLAQLWPIYWAVVRPLFGA